MAGLVSFRAALHRTLPITVSEIGSKYLGTRVAGALAAQNYGLSTNRAIPAAIAHALLA
jgi:hypothetical protein